MSDKAFHFLLKSRPRTLQGGGQIQKVIQLRLEVASAPGLGAKRSEVGVHDLAIHGSKSFHSQPPNQVHECHFGSVGGGGEHAFAEEHPSE